MSAAGRPVVLVSGCSRVLGHHVYHTVGKKYIDAVRLAGCQPLVVPSAAASELDLLLDLADGMLLTGSPSNVHPSHFDEDVHDRSLPLDTVRDAWTLLLIPKALALGVPLLGICRGAQEINVALGGSLHQAVQELPGYDDHRDDATAPVEVQYGPAHSVAVEPGGVLAKLLGLPRFDVNSLHGQAVNRLAEGLLVEARAPDGVIEAFSKPDAPGFNLCVQWHVEWLAAGNPISMRILKAFGAACSARQSQRQLNR